MVSRIVSMQPSAQDINLVESRGGQGGTEFDLAMRLMHHHLSLILVMRV